MAKVHILYGIRVLLPPNYSSWKHWWEAKKGRKATKCSNIVCNNESTVGVHVQKDVFFDTKWQVVPLCEKCSKIRGSFIVNDVDLQEFNI